MPDDQKEESAGETGGDAGGRASPLVERNVRALVEHAAEAERASSTGDRLAVVISRFAGSMRFIYFHVAAVGLWVAINRGWLPGIRPFDKSFDILGTVASCEAIFLATFVLIAQNRMSSRADTRNHLDVQVGLLTEHETTHILRLVAAMSERMEIDAVKDPEIQELVRATEPQAMLERIQTQKDEVEREIKSDSTGA
jgi:uncharacterized membrane protein